MRILDIHAVYIPDEFHKDDALNAMGIVAEVGQFVTTYYEGGRMRKESLWPIELEALFKRQRDMIMKVDIDMKTRRENGDF